MTDSDVVVDIGDGSRIVATIVGWIGHMCVVRAIDDGRYMEVRPDCVYYASYFEQLL